MYVLLLAFQQTTLHACSSEVSGCRHSIGPVRRHLNVCTRALIFHSSDTHQRFTQTNNTNPDCCRRTFSHSVAAWHKYASSPTWNRACTVYSPDRKDIDIVVSGIQLILNFQLSVCGFCVFVCVFMFVHSMQCFWFRKGELKKCSVEMNAICKAWRIIVHNNDEC